MKRGSGLREQSIVILTGELTRGEGWGCGV